MSLSTKLDEKLEGVDNFRAWKYRVMLILEEHDLEGFIEARLEAREEKLGQEDQALTVQARKGKGKTEDRPKKIGRASCRERV